MINRIQILTFTQIIISFTFAIFQYTLMFCLKLKRIEGVPLPFMNSDRNRVYTFQNWIYPILFRCIAKQSYIESKESYRIFSWITLVTIPIISYVSIFCHKYLLSLIRCSSGSWSFLLFFSVRLFGLSVLWWIVLFFAKLFGSSYPWIPMCGGIHWSVTSLFWFCSEF